MGLTLFKAKAETILEKRVFSEPFNRGRRCLVSVDGFSEFTDEHGKKQPHYFKPKDDRVMAFAGLWESWRGPIGAPLPEPSLSYTFATTEPNAAVAPIHNRMPVLLIKQAQWDTWLSRSAMPEELIELLRPAPDDLLETYPVARDLPKLKDLSSSFLERLPSLQQSA